MKYYLLTFNENWADEHNVPALQCFTEEEFDEWKNTKIIQETENYEQELGDFEQKLKEYQLYQQGLKDRNLEYRALNQLSDDERSWMKSNQRPYVSPRDKPKKGESLIYAWLGNSGDCFGEQFENFTFARELVDANIVKMVEVDKSFHTTFHKANLSGLSLCNVFEPEEMDEE